MSVLFVTTLLASGCYASQRGWVPPYGTKRLNNEIPELQENKDGIIFESYDPNSRILSVKVLGMPGTPWDGGAFPLSLHVREGYPMNPPDSVQFAQGLYHPNVYSDGKICIDTIQNNWSPALTLKKTIQSIQSMLADPNPNSPAKREAADAFRNNQREYNRNIEKNVSNWPNRHHSWVTEQGEVTPAQTGQEVRVPGGLYADSRPISSGRSDGTIESRAEDQECSCCLM